MRLAPGNPLGVVERTRRRMSRPPRSGSERMITPGWSAAAAFSRATIAGAIWYPLAGFAGRVPFVAKTAAFTAFRTTLASLLPAQGRPRAGLRGPDVRRASPGAE